MFGLEKRKAAKEEKKREAGLAALLEDQGAEFDKVMQKAEQIQSNMFKAQAALGEISIRRQERNITAIQKKHNSIFTKIGDKLTRFSAFLELNKGKKAGKMERIAATKENRDRELSGEIDRKKQFEQSVMELKSSLLEIRTARAESVTRQSALLNGARMLRGN